MSLAHTVALVDVFSGFSLGGRSRSVHISAFLVHKFHTCVPQAVRSHTLSFPMCCTDHGLCCSGCVCVCVCVCVCACQCLCYAMFSQSPIHILHRTMAVSELKPGFEWNPPHRPNFLFLSSSPSLPWFLCDPYTSHFFSLPLPLSPSPSLPLLQVCHIMWAPDGVRERAE